DGSFAEWCRRRFESGSRSLEENLWNGRYYRLYTDPDGFRQSDSIYLAELAGQGIAWMLDLGELSSRSRILDSLRMAGKWLSEFTEDDLAVGISPLGKPDASGAPFSTSMPPRDMWLFASVSLYAAELSGDMSMRDRALESAERAYRAIAESGTMW